MAPLFRADHIGSLIRPESVLAMRAFLRDQFYSTEPLGEEAQRVTNEAIAAVVDKQRALNVRPITSGEYDRGVFYAGFFEHLDGMQIDSTVSVATGCRTGNPTADLLKRFRVPYRASVIAVAPIRHKKSAYLDEWERLRQCVPEPQWKDCKLTVAPITWEHIHLAQGTAYRASSGYQSDKEYLTDLAHAMATEWTLLYDAGLRNIQVDDPALTYFLTDEMRAGCLADGLDPDELLDLYIWAQNLVLSQRPKGLHVGVHLCRGNFPNSTYLAGGSYDRIAHKLFQELDYDTFYLEYDTDRAGDFTPLREVPVGKNVVLGLVSTKHPELEDVDGMVDRVYQAADIMADGQGRSRDAVLDSLAVSPQCGFSSSSGGKGQGMTVERMWEKLQLVQEIAGRVWPQEP